jgi:hypothetical protein
MANFEAMEKPGPCREYCEITKNSRKSVQFAAAFSSAPWKHHRKLGQSVKN